MAISTEKNLPQAKAQTQGGHLGLLALPPFREENPYLAAINYSCHLFFQFSAT